MLEVSDVDLHYGAAHILRGVSVSAEPGEVTCVMGRNGVGKTSLMRAITGQHPVSGGRLRLEGEDVTRARPQVRARAGMGYVPQGREIFPLLTVRENLEVGVARLPRAQRFVPEEIYELFPILRDMGRRRGGDLSGGQQQQLAIGRALATRPKLLLLDEPTEGIQPSIIKEIGAAVRLLRDRGDMAIVLVEQYFDFAWDLADNVSVLEGGSVTVSGRRSELSADELRDAVSL